jgi:hypothetical protein
MKKALLASLSDEQDVLTRAIRTFCGLTLVRLNARPASEQYIAYAPSRRIYDDCKIYHVLQTVSSASERPAMRNLVMLQPSRCSD